MEQLEAKILLRNLLKRIRKVEEDHYELSGTLTEEEMTALNMGLALFDGNAAVAPEPATPPVTTQVPPKPASLSPVPKFEPEPEIVDTPPVAEQPTLVTISPAIKRIELDTSVFDLPPPADDTRLCLDFGTAMSKVTLVRDKTDQRLLEEIHVLELGVAGDQEEISETMLISSVFIDENGKLWFGKRAQDLSKLTSDISRLDNIKRFLSEEGLREAVLGKFNPTDINITYADLVLAYLTFLTWAVNHSLENMGEPRNLNRRFAMPCLDNEKSRETYEKLASMLGEAQVLADTFFTTLQDGIPLTDFVETVNLLRQQNHVYSFVKEGLTEPLGVAGSIISWEGNVNSLVMVVDVGAGTSDFSLYRMAYDPKSGKSTALQVANSTKGITEAGNYLDNLLKSLVLNKAGLKPNDDNYINYLSSIELDLRENKERLFTDSEVHVKLFNDEIVTIELNEFLELPQVKRFAQSLVDCRDEILQRVNSSFIQGAPNGTLALALTGGGASLPMVKDLAKGEIKVQGHTLKLVQTKEFPTWLEDEYEDLEYDYPRIAVSLGGARKRIIEQKGTANVTAGDIKSTPVLDGYFTKGM